jgi:protein PhnA
MSRLNDDDDDDMVVKDSNGAVLKDGDSVMLVRDLDVKGSPLNLKRGSTAKNIRLTHKEDEVECRFGKSTIVLKTQYLKKA